MVKRLLNVKEVVVDSEVYPRAEWNWQTSYDYAQSMKAGSKFPPILVAQFNRKYILVDGRHRLEAVKQANSDGKKGRKKESEKKDVFIQADVLTGLSMNEIFEKAIETNIIHGRQFSPYEKRRLIVKLGEMGYKIEKISKMIHIPMAKMEQFTIGNIKSDFTTGKSIVLKSPLKNADISQIEGDVEDFQRPLTVDQSHLLKQVNLLFKNNLVDFGDAGICAQVKLLKKYLRGVKL